MNSIEGITGEITLDSHLGNVENVNSVIKISDPIKVKHFLIVVSNLEKGI